MDVYKEVYQFTNTTTQLAIGKWSSIKLTIDKIPANNDTLELKVGGTTRVSFTFSDDRAGSFDQRQPHLVSAKKIYRGSDRDNLTTNQIASNIAGAFYSDPSLTSIGFGDGNVDTFSLNVDDNEITIYNNEKKTDALSLTVGGTPAWATTGSAANGIDPKGFYKLGTSDNIQPMNAVIGNGSSTIYIIADASVNTVDVGPPVDKFTTITLNLANGVIHPIRTYGANRTVVALR